MTTLTTDSKSNILPVVSNPLTADDIRALRLVDSCVCFDHVRDTTNSYGNGQGKIRCHKEQVVKQTKGSPFISDSRLPTLEYSIPVHSCVINYSARMRFDSVPPYVSCYENLRTYNEELKTLISFLKVGDSLSLKWEANIFSHEELQSVGLHTDTLKVIVTRGKGSTFKQYTFLLSVGLSKNNTARIIRL